MKRGDIAQIHAPNYGDCDFEWKPLIDGQTVLVLETVPYGPPNNLPSMRFLHRVLDASGTQRLVREFQLQELE